MSRHARTARRIHRRRGLPDGRRADGRDALRRPRRRGRQGRATQGRRPHALLGHRVGGISALWAGVNRGKRSLVRRPPARRRPRRAARPRRHAPTCSSRTSGPAWPNGSASTKRRCGPRTPDLVYVSVSGFGETGSVHRPEELRLRGADAVRHGRPAGRRRARPQLIRNIVVDKVTAMTATQSILAALLARERGAGGQHVRLSMIDTALAFLWPDGMMQHTLLADDGRVTAGPHMADGYVVRPTTDGHLALMRHVELAVPRSVPRARQAGVARPTPRFATLADREANGDVLTDLITAEVARYDGARARRPRCTRTTCRARSPTRSIDVHLDPQVQHNDDPRRARAPVARPGARATPAGALLGDTDRARPSRAQARRAHRRDPRASSAATHDTIAALRTSGAVGPRR